MRMSPLAPLASSLPLHASSAGVGIKRGQALFNLRETNLMFEKLLGGAIYSVYGLIQSANAITSKAVSIHGGGKVSNSAGWLPNFPCFKSAVKQNSAKLSEMFLGQKNGSMRPEVKNVLSVLDGIGNESMTRNGAPCQLSSSEFHSALLLGSHVVIEDGGHLYERLLFTGDKKFCARGSSHYVESGHQQYGMDIPKGLGHLLIGRTSTGDTFVQFESHGVGAGVSGFYNKAMDWMSHAASWIKHIGSSKAYVQIGPCGAIEASEKDNNHIVVAKCAREKVNYHNYAVGKLDLSGFSLSAAAA